MDEDRLNNIEIGVISGVAFSKNIKDLISALREARAVVIDTDAMYNTNGERNDYETAAVAIQIMAGHGGPL
jgi:hypothetical protein